MKKGYFSDLSTGGQISILLVSLVASMLIFSFLGALVASWYSGISFLSGGGVDYQNVNTIYGLKIMQLFQAIGLFIVPSFFAAFTFRKVNENFLSFKHTSLLYLGLAILLMIVALPLINWTAELNQKIPFPHFLNGLENWMHSKEDEVARLTELFLKVDGIGGLAINLFIMAFMAALGEELLFRGVLQKLFYTMSRNIHVSIWITAFLFSAMHLQFLTFFPRFLMGASFGYLLVWSGSIWVPILAHFSNNAFAVILHYFISTGKVPSNIEHLGSDQALPFVTISIVLTFFILNKFRKDKVSAALIE
jgi:membrane protease YdiL (CAAX protease family)